MPTADPCSIAHRQRCVTEVDVDGSMTTCRGLPIGPIRPNIALNVPQTDFPYPIYNCAPMYYSAPIKLDEANQLGRGLTDFHVAKMYSALKEKPRLLWNEAFDRQGNRQSRPLCGRSAIAKVGEKYFWLALGNRFLCGDLGVRIVAIEP